MRATLASRGSRKATGSTGRSVSGVSVIKTTTTTGTGCFASQEGEAGEEGDQTAEMPRTITAAVLACVGVVTVINEVLLSHDTEEEIITVEFIQGREAAGYRLDSDVILCVRV